MPSRPSRQRTRLALDYLLVAGTGVLFLFYLPLFAAVPRLTTRDLSDVDLLWMLPLLLISLSMVALCIWAVRGFTVVGRVLWTLVFTFAVAGCPVGYLVGMVALPGPTRRHYAQPPPAPSPPERVEPVGPP